MERAKTHGFSLGFQYVMSGFPLCLSLCTVAYMGKKLAKVLHFFDICKKKVQIVVRTALF